MKKFYTFTFSLLCSLAIAQAPDFNLEFVSNVPYAEGCNDVWGFVDSEGIEYAIVGTRTATAVVSLEDPYNPIQRAYIPGVTSTWRDAKHYKDYVYVVADRGSDGLLVINMSGAPGNITWEFKDILTNINGIQDTIDRCHNIYVDTVQGILYSSGCVISGGAVLMWDLTEDPANPKFLGNAGRRYSHDVYARGDTIYSSDISAGIFSIWDASDPANPVELATQRTTTDFTHNAWLSDDGKYLFTTDERPNAFMDAYDISDLNNIERLDSYQPRETQGRGVIPHNAHYHNGFLVTSWYSDGVKVIDGSRPENLIEVASFDTWGGPDGGFNGCWGAYPYLPSGLLLLNDIQSGLYVLAPSYERACYLEGKVTNVLNGSAISDVSVTIVDPKSNGAMTNIFGEYKSGLAISGEYDVTFSHPDYIDQTVKAILTNGEVTVLNVQMASTPFNVVTGQVIDEETKEPVEGATVAIINDSRYYTYITNADGEFDGIVFEEAVDSFFQIYAGKWGYLHTEYASNEDITAPKQYIIEISKGYQDDFIFDQGWSSSGNASTGLWELGEPVGTFEQGQAINPDTDVDEDYSKWAYVTGNGGGGIGDDDIDDGNVVLQSPPMNLATMVHPVLSYRTWFVNSGGRGAPNDEMRVIISNGIDEVTLEVIMGENAFWSDSAEWKLEDHIEITDNMHVRFEAEDRGEGHIVEAAVDQFRVIDRISTSDKDFTLVENWTLTPTLATEEILIKLNVDDLEGASFFVHGLNGQVVLSGTLTSKTQTINISGLKKGLYSIGWQTSNLRSSTMKFIKQ